MVKKKIVIVEDDFLIQELHRHYVTNLGHDVVDCFSTGKEVIEYFKDHTADLILMDIRLEDNIDGIEAMNEIERHVPVPVVYVSANNEDSSYKRAIQTNMKGFLSKPVVKGDLEKIINDLEDVTDSILYAERIQKAIFIQKEDVDEIFKDNIFLNRPKDIVTGDFCFLDYYEESKEYIGGIGDCTGHGIPAALLSVLCFQFVTNISKYKRNLKDIIYELNNNIINSLSKVNSKNTVNDSLDLVLFRILSETNEIEVSGIKREFIHYDSKNKIHNLHRLRANSLGSPIENKKDIPLLKFKYEKDDFFYFFSDGITDQFGGQFSKKITRKRVIEFLDQTIHTVDLNKKQIEFNMFLRKWQGNNEQTDDMIFLGISPSSFIQ